MQALRIIADLIFADGGVILLPLVHGKTVGFRGAGSGLLYTCLHCQVLTRLTAKTRTWLFCISLRHDTAPLPPCCQVTRWLVHAGPLANAEVCSRCRQMIGFVNTETWFARYLLQRGLLKSRAQFSFQCRKVSPAVTDGSQNTNEEGKGPLRLSCFWISCEKIEGTL